ncbi:probable LRR receptor-like serine/threonine-protein kinase At3g47570 [Abrus precatorius]|uniref:non-specific serine/threonine protein kinase n=1 Tax=Abrus precatorius TaxID=3816 RepID=A0A8B8M2X3_ABRPR|nr:probable LRR receptor-like serine/threonine-protein kinase At3g47570 [Abrus precatorius]
MKLFSFFLPLFCHIYIHLLLLFTLNLWFVPNKIVALTLESQIDHSALLKFKESIPDDPYGILASWNSSTHFCKWQGIRCNPMQERVIKLNLQGCKLHGVISPYVGNLSSMTKLNLGNNSFYGNIPQELGRLVQLKVLVLINNSLVGEFPTNLTRCTSLVRLDLAGNKLIGKIPIHIGSLGKLHNLFMERNNLTGRIPPSVGNLSSIVQISMAFNNLEGTLPQEICHMKKLMLISVAVNKLHGAFPSCLYNMSSLRIIAAARNQFNGSFPPNMFINLFNLQEFAIAGNQFSGSIPTSIINATNLQMLDIASNQFAGQVPSLGKLKDLWAVSLSENNLGDNSTKDLEFLKSLTNCRKLQLLSISINNFGGHLPISLGSLSTELRELYLGENLLVGKIPAELGNLTNLSLLTMELNYFEGVIPTTFGKFKNMQMLDLSINKLSGDIPTFIGNLSRLFALDLSQNLFEGNIPPSIGNCQVLQYLNLSNNHLRGAIPLEVFSLSSLTNLLDLSKNSLSGSLPKEVGILRNIEELDVSENHLSGDIPTAIGECTSLEYLHLQGNSFHGIIPSSLASLKGLQYLDLSRNQLSGSLPNALQNISVLVYLNVSFNLLDGEVPIEGVFRNASGFLVTGNSKLCGGIPKLHLQSCPVKDRKHSGHHNSKLVVMIVCVVIFLLMLSFILTIYWIRRPHKKPSCDSPTIDQLAKVSYQDLQHGTDGFSARNLIGSGSFGSVYKGTLLTEDKVVAIKVLNLQKKGAHKTFIAECNALKNIRHRNLAKILTCCSSIDHKGEEFKALVFEYMENGSLEQWLHPQTVSVEHLRTLNFDQRLNIIIDVASALHYLHHECEQPIIHCDLKPSNILLDEELIAHVSDFGIARLISTINGTSQKQTSTIGIRGTIGYAPPEYGVGYEVSTYGDMYSFGILMLEMLTGRRPTEEMFEDGRNLHNFVEISFPNNLLQILDPQLIPPTEATRLEGNNRNLNPHFEKCLISLFKIGLACSMESPKERMDMVDVARDLNRIRKAFLVGKINGDLLNSPHTTGHKMMLHREDLKLK